MFCLNESLVCTVTSLRFENGCVRLPEDRVACPAYLTAHNTSGAVEPLVGRKENSVIVPCAAEVVYHFHTRSLQCKRSPLVLAHGV